jgi:hypothetical protein
MTVADPDNCMARFERQRQLINAMDSIALLVAVAAHALNKVYIFRTEHIIATIAAPT